MRIFLTGGTGYIGSAIVEALLRAGHQVSSLVRSDEKAKQLEALGVSAVKGDLNVPAPWQSAVGAHDAVIHAGFVYGENSVAADMAALESMLTVAKKSTRTRSFVYTSGVWVIGNTGPQPVYEDVVTDHPAQAVAWRVAHERIALESAAEGLSTTVIRPGMVWGGNKGLVTAFLRSALEEGAASYVGDGTNRWSPIHRRDLAQLYRLVTERRLKGLFHGVDNNPLPVAHIARALSEAAGRGGATRSIPLDEARKQMGAFADALALDQAVGTRHSREHGWQPQFTAFDATVARAEYDSGTQRSAA